MDGEEDNEVTNVSEVKSVTISGSTEESPTKDTIATGGRSRSRKQTKTRRHVSDSDDGADEAGDAVESMATDGPRESRQSETVGLKGGTSVAPLKSDEVKEESEEISEDCVKTQKGKNGGKDKSSSTIDSTESLPEGTVIVHPEPVEDSNKPKLLSYGRKSLAGTVLAQDWECTACRAEILMKRGAVFQHPLLNVLLCKKCHISNTTKVIEPGPDGADELCRWCAEGGDLICCDFCHNAFCKMCVRRNMGRSALNDILNAADDVKWHCYVCDPQPLVRHMESCAQVLQAMDEYMSLLHPSTSHQKRTLPAQPNQQKLGGTTSSAGSSKKSTNVEKKTTTVQKKSTAVEKPSTNVEKTSTGSEKKSNNADKKSTSTEKSRSAEKKTISFAQTSGFNHKKKKIWKSEGRPDVWKDLMTKPKTNTKDSPLSTEKIISKTKKVADAEFNEEKTVKNDKTASAQKKEMNESITIMKSPASGEGKAVNRTPGSSAQKIVSSTKIMSPSTGKTSIGAKKAYKTVSKMIADKIMQERVKSESSETNVEHDLDKSGKSPVAKSVSGIKSVTGVKSGMDATKLDQNLSSQTAQTPVSGLSKKLQPQQRLLPRDDIIYIRTPSGAIVGIPSKKKKSEKDPHGTVSPRAGSPGQSAKQSVAPRIDEYNVWSILEKLLAATQSMGMLLGSLKEDMKRTGGPTKVGEVKPGLGSTMAITGLEKMKKKREVATKLWRAFVAYKKSFQDIETFSRVSCKTTGEAVVASQTKGSVKNSTQGTSSKISEAGLTRIGLNPTTGELIELEEDVGRGIDNSSSIASESRKRRLEPDEAISNDEKRLKVENEAVAAMYQTGFVVIGNGTGLHQIINHNLNEFTGAVAVSAVDNTLQYVHYVTQPAAVYGDQAAELGHQASQGADKLNAVEGLQYEPLLGMDMQN